MAVPSYQLYCIGGGIKTATVAGTANQITTVTTPCAGLMISLTSTFTGTAVIGNSPCYASGGALGNGNALGSTAIMFPCRNLAEVYVSFSVAATTEAARYSYFTASEP